jgi:hypothetical protein
VGQILYQRALSPYVQRLKAVTDPQDRFAAIKGIPQKKIVGCLSGSVFLCARFDCLLPIPPGIDIRRASRQQNSRAGCENARLLDFRSAQRDRNGGTSRTFYRPNVLRQAALVVSRVSRRGFRDGDTWKS